MPNDQKQQTLPHPPPAPTLTRSGAGGWAGGKTFSLLRFGGLGLLSARTVDREVAEFDRILGIASGSAARRERGEFEIWEGAPALALAILLYFGGDRGALGIFDCDRLTRARARHLIKSAKIWRDSN